LAAVAHLLMYIPEGYTARTNDAYIHIHIIHDFYTKTTKVGVQSLIGNADQQLVCISLHALHILFFIYSFYYITFVQ
jgi:hypothetical protein